MKDSRVGDFICVLVFLASIAGAFLVLLLASGCGNQGLRGFPYEDLRPTDEFEEVYCGE